LFKGSVHHFSYSSSGGAGKIASELVRGQRECGIDATLVTHSQFSPSTAPLSDFGATITALVDNYFFAKGNSELFSIFRMHLNRLSKLILDKDSIVHLHWLPGLVSDQFVSEIAQSGIPIVWTLHDQRPFTGGCHYSGTCVNYTSGCSSCPQLRRPFRFLASGSVNDRISSIPRKSITFVAPSSGMLDYARVSTIGRMQNLVRIPNPISIHGQASKDLPERASRNLQSNSWLVVAADLSEPRKGVSKVVRWWMENHPVGAKLTLVGNGGHEFSNIHPSIDLVGAVSSEQLSSLYRDALGLIFGSSFDNAPGVVAEALSFGLDVYCIDPEMRKWLREDGAPVQPIENIFNSAKTKVSPLEIGRYLADRSLDSVTAEYVKLYGTLSDSRRLSH